MDLSPAPAPDEPQTQVAPENAAVAPKRKRAAALQSVTIAQRGEAFARGIPTIRGLIRNFREAHGLQMYAWIGNPDTGEGAGLGTELVTPLVQSIFLAQGLAGAMAATRTQLHTSARYPELSALSATAIPRSALSDSLPALLRAASIKVETSRSSASFRAAHSWFPTDLQYSDISTLQCGALLQLIRALCLQHAAMKEDFVMALNFVSMPTEHLAAMRALIASACSGDKQLCLLLCCCCESMPTGYRYPMHNIVQCNSTGTTGTYESTISMHAGLPTNDVTELPEPSSSGQVTVNGRRCLGKEANSLDVTECLTRFKRRNKTGLISISRVTVPLWRFYNLVLAAGGWEEVRSMSVNHTIVCACHTGSDIIH